MNGITVIRLRVTNTSRNAEGRLKQWGAETWYSPDLKELIRLGDDTESYTVLTNIEWKDPDPKLFYPPDGYRIEPRHR